MCNDVYAGMFFRILTTIKVLLNENFRGRVSRVRAISWNLRENLFT